MPRSRLSKRQSIKQDGTALKRPFGRHNVHATPQGIVANKSMPWGQPSVRSELPWCLGSGGLRRASWQPSVPWERRPWVGFGAAAFLDCGGSGSLQWMPLRHAERSRWQVAPEGSPQARNAVATIPAWFPDNLKGKNPPDRPHFPERHPGHPGPRQWLGIQAGVPAPGATDSTAGRAVNNVKVGKDHGSRFCLR